MNKINIVFCGTPNIAAGVLETLLSMPNVCVKLVITQPDKPIGRKKQLSPTPVKSVAIKHDVKLIQPVKIGEAFEEIKNMEPDFIITCAYGQFISTKILELPTTDAINIHGSLLPKYRGGAPIQYAIKNGDKTTGISIMQMVKEMDAGDYYVQESIDIDHEDDTGTLFEKMTILAQNMIKKYLVKIYNNELFLNKQNASQVTFSKNITTSEEKIVWNNSSTQIKNQVRSLSPSPIAYSIINEQRYKIGKVLITNIKSNRLYGEIVEFNNQGVQVATKDFDIIILSIQRPNKNMIDACLYQKNNLQDLKVGDRFE